jgi:hypothetical protein
MEQKTQVFCQTYVQGFRLWRDYEVGKWRGARGRGWGVGEEGGGVVV